MKDEYPAVHAHLQKLSARLARDLRSPMRAFAQLNAATTMAGALEAKTKQLIALAIAVTARCEGCVICHVHDAIRAGATREEILEAMGISILMGGGPAVVYASRALEALDQFAASGPPAGVQDRKE